jgi:hypothetical protein
MYRTNPAEPIKKEISEACRGLPTVFPSFVFSAACKGKKAPDTKAKMIQIDFVIQA